MKLIRKVKNAFLWFLFLIIALLIAKPKGARKIIDWTKVKSLLKEAFGKDCILYLVDEKYKVPTYDNVKKFLKEDKTDLYTYVAEWFDCDDFSFRLMGQFSIPGWSDIAFGIACSGVHAYNCVIAEFGGEMKVYLIEPQTDELILVKDMMKKVYETKFIMM